MNRFTSLLAFSGVLMLAAAHAPRAESSFEQQLSKHFKAVQSRDLEKLESTLTSGSQLELILPTGRRLTTRQEFVAFHEEWFKSTTWRMQFELLTQIETPEMAIATVRARYEDVEQGEKVVRQNWLTLVFVKENGRWALVHDQNTRISTP